MSTAEPAGDDESATAVASRATLREVAQKAGVHVSTASRVLSGARTVRPETARQVRDAARLLNYEVDPIARALARQQTQTVGIVVPNIDNPFFPAVIRSVEKQLDERDKALLLCDAQDDPVVEAKRVQSLVRGRVDALLISPVDPVLSAEVVRDAARRVHVVQFDRRVDVPTDIVRVDQAEGVRLAVEHLRSHGGRRFAFVTTRQSMSTLNERTVEWQRLFAKEPANRSRVLRGELSEGWGEHAVSQLVRAGERTPDAILCGNDTIAVGVIRALKRAGVAVPEDVMVVGFDDTPLATALEPSLSSVRQPLGELGAEAVALLGRPPGRAARQMVLTPELIVRDSTARSVDDRDRRTR